jgi:NADP-dependent 3-hydroxy acid dehydrogenase YdfG
MNDLTGKVAIVTGASSGSTSVADTNRKHMD